MCSPAPLWPDVGRTDSALLRERLDGLARQGHVGVATGVLMWRHCLGPDQATAMLAELADQRGLSVERMADLLQPPGS